MYIYIYIHISLSNGTSATRQLDSSSTQWSQYISISDFNI